jgi:hypothetical protein
MTVTYYQVADEKFPKMDRLIRICFDKRKDIAWLELRNTPYLVSRDFRGGFVYEVLIGAVQGGGELAVDPEQ